MFQLQSYETFRFHPACLLEFAPAIDETTHRNLLVVLFHDTRSDSKPHQGSSRAEVVTGTALPGSMIYFRDS